MVVATCPNCGARYQLTARQIGPTGRTLKCAKCAHQWFTPPAVPEVGKAASPAQDAPKEAQDDAQPTEKAPLAPTPPEREQEERARESETDLSGMAALASRPRWHRNLTATPLGMVLLVTLLILGALGTGIWYLLKPEEQATAQRGPTPLPADTVTPPTLVLSDIRRELSRRGDTWVLTISGRLTNTGQESQPLPELRVQLLDRNGIELDYWPAELTTTQLKGGEETTWQARFLNPPLARIGSYRAFFRNAPAVLAAPPPAENDSQKPRDPALP